MFIHKQKNISFLLIFLIIISAFFRFYNLNWGAPYYFHPDERNIASSVSQIKFPVQMNPHFFAYGSLPIYTIYSTGILINFLSRLSTTTVSFEQAIQISRFFSAFFSLALIPLLFFIGKKLKDERTGLITAFFATISTGFIQFAHFGTFEIWLTFFSLLLFLLSLKVMEKKGLHYIILLGVIFGILVAAKVSHLVLLPVPLLVIIIKQIHKKKFEINTQKVLNLINDILLFFLITILVFFITNPFVVLDYSSFYGSLKYESEVALGTLPVFYIGEFVNSFPIIFQFLHVYPFLLNPLLTILFIPSFFYVLFTAVKYKNIPFLLLASCFLLLFLPQAFLYAKWTRYMVPTLPFIYLICAVALTDFWKFFSRKYVIARSATIVGDEAISDNNNLKKNIFKTVIKYLVLSIIIGVNFIFGIFYFIIAFLQEDTRIAAKNFTKQYISSNAPILSEVYDLGITPFNNSFHNITLYNFYDLDNNSLQYSSQTLAEQLAVSDYIILPSQRILKTRLQQAEKYPKGHAFYSALLAQVNGFQKIYETPCDIFCKITYMGSPVYSFEETVSVFDRPTVLIFKKY